MLPSLLRSLSICVLWISLALVRQPLFGQAAATLRSYEDILNTLPRQELLKLRGAKKLDSTGDLAMKLTKELRQKRGAFQVKVAHVEARPPLPVQTSGWTITTTDERVKAGLGLVTAKCNVFVRKDQAAAMAQVKKGTVLLVEGVITNVQLWFHEDLTMDVDLFESTVTVIPK